MKTLILSVSLAFMTTASYAADLWLLQAAADGWSDGCRTQSWGGDAVFQNTLDTPATVRLIGVSNGAITDPAIPKSFEIPPHRTVTLLQVTRGLWRASTVPPIWVTHLDVPPGVLVEGRINIGVNDYCTSFPVVRTPEFRETLAAGHSVPDAGRANSGPRRNGPRARRESDECCALQRRGCPRKRGNRAAARLRRCAPRLTDRRRRGELICTSRPRNDGARHELV